MGDPFHTGAPELDGEGWKLRPLSQDDTPAFYRYASNPAVSRFTLWPPVTEEFAQQFVRLLSSPVCLAWGIVLPEQDAIVGMVFLHSLNTWHHRAELSFNLAPEHWGRGLAPAAAAHVIRFAFERLDLNRLDATVMLDNAASRRCLEKLGFKLEGVMRHSHRRHDGFQDMQLFARLRSDSPAPA